MDSTVRLICVALALVFGILIVIRRRSQRSE